MNIEPFNIEISQSQLDDLHERIEKTVWPAVIGGQTYGGPELADMQDLAKKKHSTSTGAELNKLPH
jgi:hypothetical protein